MDTALVLQNLLSPAILFFFLGVFAVLLGSDLEIPAPLPKLFSLYLLLSIGFKGGVELQASGLGTEVLLTIGAALRASEPKARSTTIWPSRTVLAFSAISVTR